MHYIVGISSSELVISCTNASIDVVMTITRMQSGKLFVPECDHVQVDTSLLFS